MGNISNKITHILNKVETGLDIGSSVGSVPGGLAGAVVGGKMGVFIAPLSKMGAICFGKGAMAAIAPAGIHGLLTGTALGAGVGGGVGGLAGILAGIAYGAVTKAKVQVSEVEKALGKLVVESPAISSHTLHNLIGSKTMVAVAHR